MTPNELRDSLHELGMARRTLAATLGVHLVTVNRWATGALDVPSYAAAYLAQARELARYKLAAENARQRAYDEANARHPT